MVEEISDYLRCQCWCCWKNKGLSELRPLMITAGRHYYFRLRKEQAKVKNADSIADSIGTSQLAKAALEQVELREIVQQALSKIPRNQRKVIHLIFFCGQTNEEVAAILKKPLGTIKTWKRRALALLRIELAPFSPN
jgi:RNA polymerase sigma factor (sigma-70 family)